MRKAPGFVNKHQQQLEFLFTEDRLVALAGSKAEALRRKKELHTRGVLIATAAGNQGSQYVAKRLLVKGAKRQSVVAVQASIQDPA